MRLQMIKMMACAALGGWLFGVPVDRSFGQAGVGGASGSGAAARGGVGSGASAGIGGAAGQNTGVGANAGRLGIEGQTDASGNLGRNQALRQSQRLGQAQNRLNNRGPQSQLNDRGMNRSGQTGRFDDRSGVNGSRAGQDDRRDSDRSDDQIDLRRDDPRRNWAANQNQRRGAADRRSMTEDTGRDSDQRRSDTARNRGNDRSLSRTDDDQLDNPFDDQTRDDSDNAFGSRSGQNVDERDDFSSGDEGRTDLSDDNPQRDTRSLQSRNGRRTDARDRAQVWSERRDVEGDLLNQDRLDRGVGRLNNQRALDRSGVTSRGAAQDLERARRQADINRRRADSPTGTVNRGLDISPPQGGNDNVLDSPRMSDLSNPLRYDRNTRSGLPTGSRRTGFRDVDRANQQIDVNRRRFEERTGRTNTGLDNAFDRTLQNRERFDDSRNRGFDRRFDDELDNRLDDRFDDRLDDGFSGSFQDDPRVMNRR